MKNEAENMTAEREGRILQNAIDTWGPRTQTVKAMEELAELIQALSRRLLCMYLNAPGGNAALENVREEMADVSIMLNQLELIFGDTTEEEIKKLEALEKRIEIYNANMAAGEK